MNSKQFELLGYKLCRNVTDWLGNKHKYGTFPNTGSGCRNYFDSKQQLERYYSQVIEIREIQNKILQEINND